MTNLTQRVPSGRARFRLLALGLVAATLTGCGSAEGPEQALAEITPPSWFTAPDDDSAPDADPPRWTRRYAGLPKSTSDVETVYSQALDRAGWRYHAGDCAGVGAPRGGKIRKDCWTRSGLVLAFVATPETSTDEAPSRLEIMLHEAERSAPSPSRA